MYVSDLGVELGKLAKIPESRNRLSVVHLNLCTCDDARATPPYLPRLVVLSLKLPYPPSRVCIEFRKGNTLHLQLWNLLCLRRYILWVGAKRK